MMRSKLTYSFKMLSTAVPSPLASTAPHSSRAATKSARVASCHPAEGSGS